MLLLVTLTKFQGENRPILSFHLFFHPEFHPGPTAKYPQRREIACGSAALGDGGGDGERAVATPLFDGKCRPSALGVSRGFALLQGRHRPFLVPIVFESDYIRSYTGNYIPG